jgi:HEAT repeat protein
MIPPPTIRRPMPRAAIFLLTSLLALLPPPAFAASPPTSPIVDRLKALDQPTRGKPTPADMLPPLVAALNDASPVIRAYAAKTLGQLGSDAASAVPALAARLVDGDKSVRRAAIHAVVRLHPPADVVRPLLARAAADADPAVRLEAIAGLMELGSPGVPILAEMLQHDEHAYWAVLALGELGPDAAAAVPSLTLALKSPRREVREEAILALGQIGSKAAGAVPALAAALDRADEATAAAFALGRIGQPSPEAETKLQRLASGTDMLQRAIGIWALARLHPEDAEAGRRAMSLLARMLTDRDPVVRATAARAISDLPQGLDDALPEIVNSLRGAEASAVANALDALAGLGPAAVPQLRQALRFKEVRAQVANVLGRIGPPARESMSDLMNLLYDDNLAVRLEAIYALSRLGPEASQAVPRLLEVFRQDGPAARHEVIAALGRLGPPAIAARPILIEASAANDEPLALAAAWALLRIDPPREPVSVKSVPLLIRAIEEGDPRMRLEAAAALGRLGPQARPASPALQKALRDAYEPIREMAAEAIREIEK